MRISLIFKEHCPFPILKSTRYPTVVYVEHVVEFRFNKFTKLNILFGLQIFENPKTIIRPKTVNYYPFFEFFDGEFQQLSYHNVYRWNIAFFRYFRRIVSSGRGPWENKFWWLFMFFFCYFKIKGVILYIILPHR